MPKLLILSTPRTGSNLLCECLTQSGVFGHVDGFFVGHGEGIKSTFDAYSHNYIANHQAANGNFATKIMWDYIDELSTHLPYGKIDEFMGQFTHVLILHRGDQVAQAVSWYMALGCGKWTSKNEQKRPFPEYNYRRIAWHLGIIQGYEARSESHAKYMNLPTMWLSYEMSTSDLGASVRMVKYFCDVEDTQPIDWQPVPELQRQVNPLKADFIGRFNAEFSGELAHA